MKLIRYKKNKATAAWGLLESGNIYSIVGSVYDHFQKGESVGDLADVVLLPPCMPSKVVALGYNYKDLVGFQETYKEPLIFFKPPSSVVSYNSAICVPAELKKVWAEVELAFVIKKRASYVSAEEAKEYILGYTIANDVTALNIEERDHHLARSKGLDTFCPVGSYLETELETTDLALTTQINGKTTQKSTTMNRILDDFEVLALISRYITLEQGDLILTGTPAGAMDSTFAVGDRVSMTVEHLGCVQNIVLLKSLTKGE